MLGYGKNDSITIPGRVLEVMLSRRWAPTELQAVLAIIAASAADPDPPGDGAALSHRRMGELLSTSASVAGATLRRLADRGVIASSPSPKAGGPNRYALKGRPERWRVPEKIGGAKERIIREAGGRCYYCGRKVEPGTLQLDHVMPVSLGGAKWPANLVPACPECNGKKDVMGPAEFFRAMRRNRTPRPGEVVCPLLALPCPIGGPPTGGGGPAPDKPARRTKTRRGRRRVRATASPRRSRRPPAREGAAGRARGPRTRRVTPTVRERAPPSRRPGPFFVTLSALRGGAR
jgi:5-methylcytosine-specific restriction endonuclease McrA